MYDNIIIRRMLRIQYNIIAYVHGIIQRCAPKLRDPRTTRECYIYIYIIILFQILSFAREKQLCK